MQRDQFKEKIIKLHNYYQNKYYIIKLCTKNSYNILNTLICQFLVHKNMTYFEYSFIIIYYKKETKLK